jgi:Protein of unknown function (DUF3617)
MRRSRGWARLVCCLLAMTVFAQTQTRKPGLWALTSTTTWQQSPFPGGMGGSSVGGGSASPSNGSEHTTQVCVTQEYFDKYGAVIPAISGCHLSNLVKNAHGMTAEMACTGKMNGKASLESSWSDVEHATGKIHFVGSMQAGPTSKPIEWSTASSAIYKGADCGSVKPYPMPDK